MHLVRAVAVDDEEVEVAVEETAVSLNRMSELRALAADPANAAALADYKAEFAALAQGIHDQVATGAGYRFNGSDQNLLDGSIGALWSWVVGAIAMTEPGTGSDLQGIRTKAIREGDTYVVNGAKTFITNGINADLVITAVKTDPAQRHRGMSLLVIERGTPGFARGRNLDKVGMHAQDTAELFFTDARVPVDNLLGEEGGGFKHLVTNLPQERLSIAVTGVAAARQAFEDTLAYTKERAAFGQPIASFQNSRFKLAEMAAEIEAARQLMYFV